mgnify:CR=1 FL=1
MEQQHKRSAFSGKIGFVLSAAGASVGLGNIWRFPYLAAKYGGGIFLLVYILLAVTFGYTMIVAETALGRMTNKRPVSAYAHLGQGRGVRFGGWGRWSFWQKGWPAARRLDQCGHSHSDRAVLFGHWRMGHPLSVGVYQRPWQ